MLIGVGGNLIGVAGSIWAGRMEDSEQTRVGDGQPGHRRVGASNEDWGVSYASPDQAIAPLSELLAHHVCAAPTKYSSCTRGSGGEQRSIEMIELLRHFRALALLFKYGSAERYRHLTSACRTGWADGDRALSQAYHQIRAS